MAAVHPTAGIAKKKVSSPPPAAPALSLADVLSRAEQFNQLGQAEEAVALYQAWLQGSQDPLRFIALFNLATLLGGLHRYEEAERISREALALKPDLHQAGLNLGHQLEHLGRPEEAVAQWVQTLSAIERGEVVDKTLQLHALNNLARCLEVLRRYDEAEAYLVRSLQVDPDQSAVLSHYVHLRQKQCKWPVYQPLGPVTVNRQLLSTSALAMLAASDEPAMQLMAAREFVHSKVQSTVPSKPKRVRQPGERIRIGYLSGDLCMHAVGLLTVELFELHDRQRFEVFGFCWSKEDGSPLRQRIVKGMDHLLRIGHLTDAQAAQVIESLGIDVLVDLQGLTSGARPNILSLRPAPVQVSYLGLPATSALPGVDYILADPFVFPAALEPYMTEKPLRVPRCYQVSDRQRPVGPALTRAQCGLPEDHFVFASFNNNYKFSQEMFACWMRVLQQVPNSVLWLMADNAWAEANMKAAAAEHGVLADRLIFTGRAAPEEYLARLRLPDVFLDTFPYNAGTTANDILWMGTPIVTLSGRTYISRMCGSLLTAVGLPELVTTDLAAYERMAVLLGQQPARVRSMKRYLAEYGRTSDLFNVPQLVRDIEDAFASVA